MTKLEKNRAKVYSSIELLPAQIEQAWSIVATAKMPVKYKDFNNIIICGMGGSIIGFHMIRQALGDKINIPVILHSDYKLPEFVNKKSLIILSSYSGNTEEVLSCVKEVVTKKFNGYIITGNGKLAKIIGKVPGVALSIDFNPSNEPRWGLGYSIGSFLQILNKIGVASVSEAEFLKANISQSDDLIGLAKQMSNKQIVVIAAEHLVGNAHVFCNQLNETANNMATWLAIPELNHHFLEAFSFPKGWAQQKLVVLFLNSAKYSTKIEKRVEITKKVLDKKGIKWLDLFSDQKNQLSDSLSTLQRASFLCYYVSVANKVDPIAIPTVDFFKKEMKK